MNVKPSSLEWLMLYFCGCYRCVTSTLRVHTGGRALALIFLVPFFWTLKYCVKFSKLIPKKHFLNYG